MKEGMTRRQWEKIEKVLDPCPFCGQRVRLFRSDGGDCRMSRECRHGFYIRCLACDLPGWEQSKGARIEVGLARDANLPVIELDKVVEEFGR